MKVATSAANTGSGEWDGEGGTENMWIPDTSLVPRHPYKSLGMRLNKQ